MAFPFEICVPQRVSLSATLDWMTRMRERKEEDNRASVHRIMLEDDDVSLSWIYCGQYKWIELDAPLLAAEL